MDMLSKNLTKIVTCRACERYNRYSTPYLSFYLTSLALIQSKLTIFNQTMSKRENWRNMVVEEISRRNGLVRTCKRGEIREIRGGIPVIRGKLYGFMSANWNFINKSVIWGKLYVYYVYLTRNLTVELDVSYHFIFRFKSFIYFIYILCTHCLCRIS